MEHSLLLDIYLTQIQSLCSCFLKINFSSDNLLALQSVQDRMTNSQSDQCDGDITPFLIYEIVNILLTAPFLVIFAYRLFVLKPVSTSNKYRSTPLSTLEFYPRFRVLLSFCYIIVSIVDLAFNITEGIQAHWLWYIYFLGGGTGAFINSIALVIELIVLRMQLSKEQPYTPYHLIFFVVLTIASTIRTIFCILYFCMVEYTDKIFSSLLTLFSLIQLIYWGFKRQSLPHFQNYLDMSIDNILQNRIIDFNSQTSLIRSIHDNFPYLLPQITVKNGQFNITLELYNPNKTRQSWPKDQEHKQHLFPLIVREKEESEIVSDHFYGFNELVQIYTLCGLLPIHKEVHFQVNNLPMLAREFQQFLQVLLVQKRNYHPTILQQFHVPEPQIAKYSNLRNERNIGVDEQTDQITGLQMFKDNNALYCSVNAYKYKWIIDHYVFYFKIRFDSANLVSYPTKRYSEFQQFHNQLKNIIKRMGKQLELPSLPKKSYFHLNDEQAIKRRKKGLEKYLKKITNDYFLMESTQIKIKILNFLEIETKLELKPKFGIDFYKNLQVEKGETKKVILKKDYVVLYTFVLFRSGVEVKIIEKRYSDFEELHNEMERWMKNIKTLYHFLVKPPKTLKSETERHEQMLSYLRNLIQINDIECVYAASDFFNVGNNEFESISEISEIEAQGKSRISNSKVIPHVIELLQRSKNPSSRSSRFSKIIDDLGNENYD